MMATMDTTVAGDAAFAIHDFKKALSLYSESILQQEDDFKRNPMANADLYTKRGQCYYQLQNYEASMEDVGSALAKNSSDVMSLVLKGKCLTALNRFPEAYSVLQRCLEADSKNQSIAECLRDLRIKMVSQLEEDESLRDVSESFDAVTLCNQLSYPGDEELEVLETDIMTKWKLGNVPELDSRSHDALEAKVNLDLARKALAEGKQCDALDYIDMALERDPHNASLWLQRATVLLALGDVREAFRSCNAIPPNSRTVDQWKMGGSILDKLDLPVHAEIWLRHATKLTSDKDDHSAAILFQKVRVKRLYSPLTRGSSVEVVFAKNGRCIKAVKDIKKGEIILRDSSTIHAQTLPSLRFPCCANCVKSLIKPEEVFDQQQLQKLPLQKALKKYWPDLQRFPCDCQHEVYCSLECRQDAWDSYHRILCPKLRPVVSKLYQVCLSYLDLTKNDNRVFDGWWNASFSPLILAKIWASIICQAQHLAHAKNRATPSPEDWAKARAPYRRFIAHGSHNNSNTIPKMHALLAEIFHDVGDGIGYDITRQEFDGRYFQTSCNVQSFSDANNPMAHFCRRIHQDPQFAFILSYCRAQEHEGDFAGLFPLHACMNHSCVNNAFVSDGETKDGRPGCQVKAKRDISAGEEICIPYLDTTMSRRERRLWLYRAYNFWCQCLRCQFEGDGPKECTECGQKNTSDKPLPVCGRCKQAWYCSTQCQKKAWKRGHKKICGLEL